MIQRVQTIYLVIAIILQLLLFYLPVYYISPISDGVQEIPVVLFGEEQADMEETASTALSSQSTWLLVAVVLNALVIIFAFIAILLYKNRLLQIKISNLGAFMAMLLTGVIFYSAYAAAQVLADPSAEAMYDTSYTFGTWLPVISIVLFFFAARAIRKDEELVRSADRLR